MRLLRVSSRARRRPCLPDFPGMRLSPGLWLGPPDSTSLPWRATRSTIAAAGLSSARTVPHRPDPTLVADVAPLPSWLSDTAWQGSPAPPASKGTQPDSPRTRGLALAMSASGPSGAPSPLAFPGRRTGRAVCQNPAGWPAEVAAMLRAVAMWVLPRPVRPQEARSPASRANASEHIPSRPQPSGRATLGQSKASSALGTGDLACRSGLAPFALSRRATSDPGIAVHAAACPGVAEARRASIVSPDTEGALAAPRKAACEAPRPELVCGMPATPLEQPRRPVAGAQVDLLAVIALA
jgi:hypothetical protein